MKPRKGLKSYNIKIYLANMQNPKLADVIIEAKSKKEAIEWVKNNIDVR